MQTLPSVLLIVVFACLFGNTHAATTVYRCVGSDGVIKFQDTPCRSDESARKMKLADVPPVPVIEPTQSGGNKSTADPAPDPIPSSTPVFEPEVEATLCTREDGSRYLSDSGRGEQRAVPLGMLGVPRGSLADAYAGRDGIGVSAPGLRTPPVDRTRYGQLGAMYVWVEDPCFRINVRQLCEFLSGKIEDAERRLRFAFSDTSAQVQQELDSLRQRAKQCSR